LGKDAALFPKYKHVATMFNANATYVNILYIALLTAKTPATKFNVAAT
jgi:hypothetical protein